MKESQSFCSHQMVFSKWSKNTFLSYLEVSKNSQDFELKNHVMCLYTTVWRALDSSHRKKFTNAPFLFCLTAYIFSVLPCKPASNRKYNHGNFRIFSLFHLTLLYFLELGEERNMVLCLQKSRTYTSPIYFIENAVIVFCSVENCKLPAE